MILPPHLKSEWYVSCSSDCFYCGQEIDQAEIAIFWQGTSGITLHRDCSSAFGAELIADAREARLAAGEAHWATRAAKVAGLALMAGEMKTR